MAVILIVDDLASNRRALAAPLSARGHRLLEAENGHAGLAVVQSDRPDLVISDVLMPVLDGYEFVRRLRLDPATAALPVLFYTAPYGEREARAMARASGVPYVLTKPPLQEEVLKIVDLVLAGGAAAAGVAGADAEQLQLLGDQLSETADDLRRANARLRALINIGLDFASMRDSAHRLRRACWAVHDLFGASYVTIGILGRDCLLRSLVCSDPDVEPWIAAGDRPPGIFGTVITERRSTRGRVTNAEPGSRLFPARHPEVQHFLIAPITSPTSVYGWICLVGNDERAFTAAEEQQVLAMAGYIGRLYELEHETAERLEVESALRQSERLNRNLLEHLPHRIVVRDRQSVVRFCNTNYARDLGRRVEDVVGKDATAFHPADMAEASNASDREVMDSGVLHNIEEPYHANGERRWVRTVKVPYRDEQGEVTGVLVVSEDITSRRAQEEQFQQAQKMEAIGQLAGGIAHDFNNLLTAILGYCGLLLDDLQPGDRHGADVTEIQKAGQRAAELTRQLLAFSRKEIIAPSTFDLNVVLADMRAMLDRLIRENVTIVLGLAPDLSLVTIDRSQLEQIVINLAVNGRDAMPDGGTLTIETADVELDQHYAQGHPGVAPGPHVCLTVTDTGIGMSPEVMARIFEPFFTTKTRGSGTGLGLASVQGTIARSGGSVTVYSEIGKGSAFKVYFPRAAAATATAPAPPAVVNQLGGTETVLVVEDADGLRNLIGLLLARQGYTVLSAANAGEARRLFDEHPDIAVILADVVMPGASGPELTRELLVERPSLKVIYMSGYPPGTIDRQGVLLAGIAFLPKPFTADALGRKLRSVLDSVD
ncbi:MAG: response regulator [Acidobacteriota bacterium]|nr:response regulator [Acidobacteriota bacterium]